jgi:UDP-glucose/iron transport system ATP-binding protein
MMSESHALEMRDVTVRFDGRNVLQDFSMSLDKGQKVLLTGPSGCGKSCVLRCLLGFILPGAGSVHLNGDQLTAETAWSLRQQLAYVGQEPDLGNEIVSDVFERPFHYRANVGLRDNLKRVPKLLEKFGLAQPLLNKEASDLSGGEKQRIALIAAILLDRPIFLLDEATSALDQASKTIVAEYFRSRGDISVLFVAHDTGLFTFADEVVQMQEGRYE